MSHLGQITGWYLKLVLIRTIGDRLRIRQTSGYIQVVEYYRDTDGRWRYYVIRSFGSSNDSENLRAASRFIEEFSRYVEDPESPIPCGTVDDELWAGLRETISCAPLPHPAAPLLMVRDLLTNLGAGFAKAVGNLREYLRITQPHMDEDEREKFLRWIRRYVNQEDDLLKILSLKWCYPRH